jgi:hypothetical protein
MAAIVKKVVVPRERKLTLTAAEARAAGATHPARFAASIRLRASIDVWRAEQRAPRIAARRAARAAKAQARAMEEAREVAVLLRAAVAFQAAAWKDLDSWQKATEERKWQVGWDISFRGLPAAECGHTPTISAQYQRRLRAKLEAKGWMTEDLREVLNWSSSFRKPHLRPLREMFSRSPFD